MELHPAAFAERSRYRAASIGLMLASWLAIAGVFIGVPDVLCFLVALVPSIILTIITYHRLRDAALSGAWILLMIVQIGIGPTWHLSDSLTVNFGGYLVGCVPIILGWLVAANSGANPKSKSI
ncbi:hypothetical protein [Sphingomonas sp.]|jgi:uncharacterized membrane protein YhaH (DUF805 family)|uniref:hypothetical protein n=1 Tax=Sphingomonas sp. TaxID=28214 RepID=UPI002E13E21F|nr:hypothetical protein [Sphingomonas sp.]